MPYIMPSCSKQAFSLVELSIVLVILGLLVGGVLSGQSLIRASELRTTVNDFQNFQSATLSFRDKYFALPGDMTNATTFWTSLGGTGSDATCQNLAATGTATCNGNGDGILYTNVVTFDENTRFWQHLANAGLVAGSYTGLYNGAYVAGVNAPLSKLARAYWIAQTSAGLNLGGNNNFAADYGNTFVIRGANPNTTIPGSFAFKPEDAWNIDTKLDDGIPGTGKLISNKGNSTNTNCTSFAGVAPPGDVGATYQLTNPSRDCALYYLRVF